jgi:1,4-alpha-glucan branching enzyme
VAGVRGLLGYLWAFPGKKLIFMGTELVPETEWSEQFGLDWSDLTSAAAAGVARLISDLNRVYRAEPALWALDRDPAGFDWLAVGEQVDSGTDDRAIALLRRGAGGSLVASVTNLCGANLADYRLGLPLLGRWIEVINTDAADYGGSGIGNLGAVAALDWPVRGQPASAAVQVGPYATVWLRYGG